MHPHVRGYAGGQTNPKRYAHGAVMPRRLAQPPVLPIVPANVVLVPLHRRPKDTQLLFRYHNHGPSGRRGNCGSCRIAYSHKTISQAAATYHVRFGIDFGD